MKHLLLCVGFFVGCSGDSFTDGVAEDAAADNTSQESAGGDAFNNSDTGDAKGFLDGSSEGDEVLNESGSESTGTGGSAGAGAAGSAGAGGIAGTGGSAGAGGDFSDSGSDVGPCVAKSCTDLGANCGPTPDTCGGTIPTCGTCPSNQTCAGGGVANVCGGCVPKQCYQTGIVCGHVDDGCGNTLYCPFNRVLGQDSRCSGQYQKLNYWSCGTYGTDPIAGPPYPDCVKPPTGPASSFCCKE
jgi:hypothetical protein